MMRKIVIVLGLASILIQCKRDKKNPERQEVTNTSDTVVESDTHAYSFISNHEDLQKLYTSDAWDLVLVDTKKMGVVGVEVARLGATYFVNYQLQGKDNKKFRAYMEVLPSFKNFKEMSEAITGVPMDYGGEMVCLFDLSRSENGVPNTISGQRTLMTLPMSGNEARHSLFEAIFRDKRAALQFTLHLEQIGVLDLKLYRKTNALFMAITTATGVAPESLTLEWDKVLQEEVFEGLQAAHPSLKKGHTLTAGWESMEVLSSSFVL